MATETLPAEAADNLPAQTDGADTASEPQDTL